MKKLLPILLCLTGCGQSPLLTDVPVEPQRDWPLAVEATELYVQNAPIEPLVDVGIVIFDVGQGVEGDVAQAVRDIEARLMAHRLRTVLVESGAWGAVRILPAPSALVPVTVTARLEHSDGRDLVLDVSVQDSSGEVWIDQQLHGVASDSDYPVASGADPFDELWFNIANRMVARWQSLSLSERERINQIAELRYARQLAPQAFAGFLDESGEVTRLARLPSRDDPMLGRIGRLRDYELMFIDAIDEQFVDLQRDVGPTYDAWRAATKAQADWLTRYNERVTDREIDASRGSFASMHAVYATYRASRIQQQDLYDFALGFSNESSPTVLEYQDRVVELDGSLSQRYQQWRELLADIFRLEQGVVD